MAKDEGDEAQDRWLIVDTGFGRYLGKLEDGPGWRDGKPSTVYPDAPEGLTGKPELRLSSVVRIENLNLPTREGISVQSVPSSPIPWLPLFSRDAAIKLPVERIVWYDDVDGDAVAEMRAAILGAGRGPGLRPV